MDRQKLTTAAPEASFLRHLEADRLIETGQSLEEIAALFPTKPAGYEYFVNRMIERYAAVDSRCAACGEESEGSRCEFVWRAHINTAKTVLISFLVSAITLVAHHLYSRTILFRFATYHRLCPACWRRYRLRRWTVAVLEKLLFAVLITVLLLTVPALAFVFVGLFAAPEVTLGATLATAAGFTLLGLVFLGFEGCRRWLIPRSLRPIGRSPFRLERVEKTGP